MIHFRVEPDLPLSTPYVAVHRADGDVLVMIHPQAWGIEPWLAMHLVQQLANDVRPPRRTGRVPLADVIPISRPPKEIDLRDHHTRVEARHA